MIEKWENRKDLVLSCVWLRGWKSREIENYEKWNWYKFTIMSLLNKTKGNTIFYTHLFI